MIELKGLTKSFGEIEAVKDVNVTIKEGAVFGLIGTNGAGKSTVLRLMAGVLKPDAGLALVDNMPVYDNVDAKGKLFFIADEPYFSPMRHHGIWSAITAASTATSTGKTSICI